MSSSARVVGSRELGTGVYIKRNLRGSRKAAVTLLSPPFELLIHFHHKGEGRRRPIRLSIRC